METGLTPALQATLGDRYRIEREIGRGGMATVYLAEDTKHERMVALKVLHPELAAAVGPQRFRREIAIVAQLQHPHILPLLDSGESPGGPLWFTMPYVDGESLRQRLTRDRQLPLTDALRIAGEIAAALEYAHSRGVIHRDIKPENILLASDGQALLADFGVARDTINLGAGSTEHRLTDAGSSVGTLEYMSPEQTAGQRNVDARTDVYSLGCVLYEMLAGEPPFTGATPQALVARRLVERPLPLRAVRDRIPESVAEAVDIALARAPADRFQTARKFAEALSTADSRQPSALTPGEPSAVPAGRAVKVGLRVVAGAVLIAAGAYGVRTWYRHRQQPIPSVTALAVIPFENLGDSSASYFTDGVTDEIRSKLTALPELQVIARGSSVPYQHSAKSLQEIASELGVRYLVTGQVRWERSDGKNRVRVDPELVQVTDGSSPSVKWQQPFDIDVSDVLAVQSAIATNIATALNVTLSTQQQQRLAARPTKNAAAYDAFLKGEAFTESVTTYDPTGLRRGAESYTRAVTLDPEFGAAWAQLAATEAALYHSGASTPDNAQTAEFAVTRAQALAPDARETLHAISDYEFYVRQDYVRVRAVDSAALVRYPNDASFLTAVAADEQDEGQFEAALARLRHAEALDPRANRKALAHTLLYLRRYPEADAVLDGWLAQHPADLDAVEAKAMVALGRGDLSAARAVLNTALQAIGDTTLVLAHFANFYGLYWLPDEHQQQRLLALSPSAFDDDRGQWALGRAEVYWGHGDTTRARMWADSARRVFAGQIRETPNNAMLRLNYGESLAYLGRKADAVEQAERGAAMVPVSENAYTGPFYQEMLARVYTFVGESDKALDHLELLVRNPYVLSAAWLKIDPTWAPLRRNARFARLTSE